MVPLGPTGVAAAAGALRWTLPGWAGPVDLLLIATPDGGEPGLALLAEQAYRRGCTVVAVAPDRTPVSEAVQGAHGLAVPMATAPGELPEEEPVEAYANGTTAASGALWALLTPLLLLLGRTGLVDADTDAVHDLADRLDTTAERCGPAVAAYSNPAKTLAAELAESLPSSGPRARAPDRSAAASPPSSPRSPGTPPSPRPSPRHSRPTARSLSAASPTRATPTTSSGTASTSPSRCAPASSCSATARRAASPPPPPPANSPSPTTPRSANSNRARAATSPPPRN